ncbi:asparagine synthase (glutamine-hydrolyzing) [Alloscardovia venturai]|uniref:asparagine synthase (glutamine-hydrolyzing) n=1 Tax=Alloscardovia venturai TaxID=1769421 RepID=A0ABW2Y6T0_9BIFI
MCGIVGFITPSLDDKYTALKAMMDTIIHRGPSSEGSFIDDTAALGFRRLSIIDLEGGSQPIYNEDHSLVITFNGEIYNFRTLKDELEKAGHTFTTHADTEVILHGYEQWGKDVVKRLRGMFAFVIWDMKSQTLFGARDHFGIKPFYYAKLEDGGLIYGSEIKSFLPNPLFKKELNHRALRPFLEFQYSALDEETFFKGVYRLKEGHCFTYHNGSMTIEEYWDSSFQESDEKLEDVIDSIDKAVCESIKTHRIADVEVGSFLSSGVDSSYVAAVLKPDKTYSVGFDKTYNEAVYAEQLTDKLGIHHESRIISGDEAFDAFPAIQYFLDEPDANPSCVPLYFLAQLAAREVRVVMSGEGADEMFGGYADYGPWTTSGAVISLANALSKLPKGTKQGIVKLLKKMPNFKGKLHLERTLEEPRNFFVGQAKIFDEAEASDLVTDKFKDAPSVSDILNPIFDKTEGLSHIKQMQYNDFHHFMAKDILLKADKMAMAHSLELRVPFLDRKVMEVAQKVPTPYLVHGKTSKYAMREAAARHLPEGWFNRPKMGFPTPIKSWLETEKYYKHVRGLFEEDFVTEFFDQPAILKLLDDTYTQKANNRRKVWTIFSFLTWYKEYFIKR